MENCSVCGRRKRKNYAPPFPVYLFNRLIFDLDFFARTAAARDYKSRSKVNAKCVCAGWRRGVVVSGVRRMNEVNARRARLVPGWVTVFGRVYHLGM